MIWIGDKLPIYFEWFRHGRMVYAKDCFYLKCLADVNVPYRGLLFILAAVKMTGFKLPHQEQPNNPDILKLPSDDKNLTLRILP